jgi:hypothetical protein
MKKELKEGMGFICETLEDKKRIWQKLTDAGYPCWEGIKQGYLEKYKYIYFDLDEKEFHLINSLSHITDPLNESDFFDEWTPKPGEWVEVSDNKELWTKRQYLATVNRQYICVVYGGDIHNSSGFNTWLHIRQIKPETITLEEAQDKLRELLNKPNLTITP